jgi:hypothetical protein
VVSANEQTNAVERANRLNRQRADPTDGLVNRQGGGVEPNQTNNE